MVKEKEVSTRLIRSSQPHLDINQLLLFVEKWNPAWELDASIKVFDEGIAQYLLSDAESHYKYYAALILNKPSLRCSIVQEEPHDELEDNGNRIIMHKREEISSEDTAKINYLCDILSKRGYRFD